MNEKKISRVRAGYLQVELDFGYFHTGKFLKCLILLLALGRPGHEAGTILKRGNVRNIGEFAMVFIHGFLFIPL